MWTWFNRERDPNLPKINDIRIVKLTHHMPDGTTYDRFEVQRYWKCIHEDWYSDFMYHTMDQAEARADKLIRDWHPVKIVETVVKEYKQ